MSLPPVSVIVPVRNEADHIVGCLESIRAQDYGGDIEVIVVDGCSTDDTRELVSQMMASWEAVRLLDNPKKVAASALNIGIQAAKGDVIFRVDGHSRLEQDYISKCVYYLQQTGADNVGGLMVAVGEGYVGEAIAFAKNSLFGVGNSNIHHSDREGYAELAWPGAFRREVFQRVGLFDEELMRNQDNVFNYRLHRAGGKIYFSPSIKTYSYTRSTLRALWRQHWDYAYWNVRAIQKYPQAAVAPRHLVPLLFVLGLFGSAALSLVHHLFGWLFLAIAGGYAVANLGFSIAIAARNGWRYLPILPFVFACIHFSYGFGYFGGFYGRVRKRFAAAVG